MRRGILVAFLLPLLALPGAAKERYNVWAKEKIRYQHDRVNQDPYNAQLRVLLANAYYGDGKYYDAAAQLEKALELEGTLSKRVLKKILWDNPLAFYGEQT